MTRIYLIRHAEAEGNLYRIVQGQGNSNLTDRGWRQVKALERRFADIHIDDVYTSDLYRTCATASAIYKPKDGGIGEIFDAAVLRIGKPVRDMNKADRIRVIEHLKEMDAFSYRRAVPYVATHLGVSRYTIYKYLDEVNGKPMEDAEQEDL